MMGLKMVYSILPVVSAFLMILLITWFCKCPFLTPIIIPLSFFHRETITQTKRAISDKMNRPIINFMFMCKAIDVQSKSCYWLYRPVGYRTRFLILLETPLFHHLKIFFYCLQWAHVLISFLFYNKDFCSSQFAPKVNGFLCMYDPFTQH